MKNIFFSIATIFISYALSHSAPSITGASGTFGDGNTVTISGSGFGTQPHSKPSLYADFENQNEPNSTLGQASTWTARTNMSTTTTSVFEGSYSLGSNSGWESSLAQIRKDYSDLDNKKMIISVWRKTDHVIKSTENWKWIRLWSPADGDNYPNWYNGQLNGGIFYVESCNTNTHRKTPSNGYSYTRPNSNWKLDEYIIDLDVSTSSFDGSFYVYSDGVLEMSSTTWSWNCGGQTGTYEQVNIQDDPSSFTPTGDVYYDLVYIDTGTWSRVYISSSTSVSSRRFLQPYSSWADGSITITQEFGDLSGDDIYLYVCDNDNTCSSSFDLTQIQDGFKTEGVFSIEGSISIQ